MRTKEDITELYDENMLLDNGGLEDGISIASIHHKLYIVFSDILKTVSTS
jgi:hypothetical protein